MRLGIYVAALYFGLTSLVIEGYYIPSGSMAPTLLGAGLTMLPDGREVESSGDRVMALKGLYLLGEPRRGDIIIFERVQSDAHASADDSLLVKRVVALPGEEVEIKDEWVWVRPPGGQAAPLPRTLSPSDTFYENRGAYGQRGRPVTVPPGHYFVLGDNTMSSNDSRMWGFVPRAHVRGRVVVRFWPLDRLGWVR